MICVTHIVAVLIPVGSSFERHNTENSPREEYPGWKGTKETNGVFGMKFY